ncbi:MAG: mannose-1-phosphate guanylyltransferase, partial [Pseudobdellovibrionaceae bacterium]
MIPVIISGGSGTRLWPVSRTQFPKQFCHLWDQSLFELTLGRCGKLGTPRVLTTVTLKDLTQKKLRQFSLDTESSLFEPLARNTAPAVAWLCHSFLQQSMGDEVVGIFPADQLIEKESTFVNVIRMAEKFALQGKVVTIGIEPTFPATGFGYIQTETKALEKNGELAAYSVLKFHEKPDVKTAQRFLNDGGFHWNAGIFVFQVKTMAGHFEKHQPELWKKVSQIKADGSNLKEVYEKLEKISVDHGIMEKLKSHELVCVPADLGWSDVGSWDAVAEISAKDKKSNNLVSEIHGKGNSVFPVTEKSYALLGVEDLIVVDTEDALLISKKGQSQDVRLVVDEMIQKN